MDGGVDRRTWNVGLRGTGDRVHNFLLMSETAAANNCSTDYPCTLLVGVENQDLTIPQKQRHNLIPTSVFFRKHAIFHFHLARSDGHILGSLNME